MTRGKRSFQSNGLPVRQDRDGFAQPVKPLRVFLARDQELGNAREPDTPDSDVLQTPTLSSPPPAYGRWRCSVVFSLNRSATSSKANNSQRADPNLLHWQPRNDISATQEAARVMLHDLPPNYSSNVSLDHNTGLETPATVREMRRSSRSWLDDR